MSSLDPDRLSTSPRRATATATVNTSTTRTAQRRGALSTGSTSDATPGRPRTARSVTATVARTATATAARTASATAKAAATGARAATAKASAARASAAARRAASAEPVAVPKPRTARTAKPATTEASTAKAAAPQATPAKATAKATASKATPAKVATAKATPAEATVTKAAAATAPAPAEAPTVRRPTPFPRTPVVGPTVQDVVLPAGPVPAQPGSLSRLLAHRPPSVRRRPSLYLAAALATVIGVSGGLSSPGPAAQAGTESAGATISVAEQLGIPENAAAPIVDAETADRLGELVASRAERDAEQTQAARAQAKADRAAAEAERRAAAAAAEAARPKAAMPVEGARLTSGFGARWGTLHAGIDLAAPMGTPEYAVMDGVVLEAGPASGFGLAVYIQHENGDVTVYGHMDEILVSAGQVVKAGDTIALLGNTGQSTGPHLHFEVHQGGLGGTKIDPLPWLRERGLDI